MSKGTFAGAGRPDPRDLRNFVPAQPVRPQMPESIKASMFPETIHGRSTEKIEEVERFLNSMVSTKEGTVVIRRHKYPEKVGSIFTPETVQELYNKKTCTGTVLKMRLADDSTFLDKNGNPTHVEFGVGDYVLFTQYAPFFAYDKFPDLQIIHAEDILFKLTELPPGIEDRW